MHPKTIKLSKAAVLRTLTARCAIQAAGARTSDGHGGYKTTFATKTDQGEVPCRIVSPKPSDVAVFADKIRGRSAVGIQFEAETDVAVGERIVCGGVIYSVIGIKAPVTNELIRPVLAVVFE